MDWLKLAAGRDVFPMPGGFGLRLLSAMEVLEAKREAAALAEANAEDGALCANACIIARAWVKQNQPVFASGEAVLRGLSVSQILRLSRLWAEFDREENPGVHLAKEDLDALKKAWSTRPRNACAGVCSKGLGFCPPKRGI